MRRGPSRTGCGRRPTGRSVARDGADAVAAAMTPPGRVATLILPADASWNEADGPAPLPRRGSRAGRTRGDVRGRPGLALRRARDLVHGRPCPARPGLKLAGRIAAKTGARLLAQTLNARVERGAGRVAVEFLPYPVDAALATFAGARHLVLVGSEAPVAFFAYPDKPSVLSPPQCETHTLATPGEDIVGALEALAEELGGRKNAPVQAETSTHHPRVGDHARGGRRSGRDATSGRRDRRRRGAHRRAAFLSRTRGRPRTTYLQVTGGAIGIGLPLATGAAVACPDRKVVCLQADGSAMYTVQALWTQAREGLDVTTLILNNRSYAILKQELANVGPTMPGAGRSR